MVYKFVIPTTKEKKMPNLNDFIKAERVSFRTQTGKFMTKGAVMKKEWQTYVSMYIRKDLRGIKIDKPVIIHYRYFEPDKKRDYGNIHAFCQKVAEDALQECGTIINDNQKYVRGFTADFDIDKANPRIEIELEEIEYSD